MAPITAQRALIRMTAAAVLTTATASFAQSSVTITGAITSALNFNTTTLGSGASISTSGMFNNPTGTSSVIFTGVEDLGSGMKGMFLYEMDPNANYNNSAPLSGEVYVGLSAGWGTLKMGAPNQPSVYTQSFRSPFGVRTGSGFGVILGAGLVRQPGSMVYTSPTFNGFTVGLGYRPEVSAGAAGAAVAANTAGLNTLAAAAAMTDLSLSYADGPLAAGLSFASQDATAAGSNPGATAGLRQTNYYVQYAFGAARVYFGGHNEDILAAGTGAATNDTGNNIALKYTMGNIDWLANWAVKRNAAAGTDQRITGLGMDYNLSKRTGVIVRINQQDNDGAAAAATAQTRNVMAGLIHRF